MEQQLINYNKFIGNDLFNPLQDPETEGNQNNFDYFYQNENNLNSYNNSEFNFLFNESISNNCSQKDLENSKSLENLNSSINNILNAFHEEMEINLEKTESTIPMYVCENTQDEKEENIEINENNENKIHNLYFPFEKNCLIFYLF